MLFNFENKISSIACKDIVGNNLNWELFGRLQVGNLNSRTVMKTMYLQPVDVGLYLDQSIQKYCLLNFDGRSTAVHLHPWPSITPQSTSQAQSPTKRISIGNCCPILSSNPRKVCLVEWHHTLVLSYSQNTP